MSGHSKWSTIKRKKEKTDSARAKVFTKIGREIAVAVKEGGADPDNNSKLKDIISKAKSNNVPNDNIERIIKKAAGDSDKNNYESITYEGYGPAGVAIIVNALTDNRNRTASNVRHYFDKFGGNLGTTGCVSYLFEKKGIILVENQDIDDDKLLEDSLEAGAQDIDFSENGASIETNPSYFSVVREALDKKGYKIAYSEIEMVPNTTVNLKEEKDKENMKRLINSLEEDDDVNEIFNNLEDESELFN